MAATNDCIYYDLGVTGYPGTVYDKLVAWLKASGATGESLHDLWMSFLSAYDGSFNDRLNAWLDAEGAVGNSLADKYNDYWCRIAVPT